MLYVSAVYAVVWCLAAGYLSVTSVYCVETAKDTATAAMNANRKLYQKLRTVPFSIIISDLQPKFKGHDVFNVE